MTTVNRTLGRLQSNDMCCSISCAATTANSYRVGQFLTVRFDIQCQTNPHVSKVRKKRNEKKKNNKKQIAQANKHKTKINTEQRVCVRESARQQCTEIKIGKYKFLLVNFVNESIRALKREGGKR